MTKPVATSGAATTSRRLAADQLAAASGETGQPFDKTCEVQLVSGHMATTISQSFSILKSNLEVTGLQQSTVSTRRISVRSVMEVGRDREGFFFIWFLLAEHDDRSARGGRHRHIHSSRS